MYSLAVFGQHLIYSHGQARPDSSHNEAGFIIQTLALCCPPCGPGHMTSVQCRIRTIIRRSKEQYMRCEKYQCHPMCVLFNISVVIIVWECMNIPNVTQSIAKSVDKFSLKSAI